jgi:hypothetical protein
MNTKRRQDKILSGAPTTTAENLDKSGENPTKHGGLEKKLKKITLAGLNGENKGKAIDAFTLGLKDMLYRDLGRQDVLAAAAKALDNLDFTPVFDVRQFDNFLVELGQMGLLKVFPQTDSDREAVIKKMLGVSEARVVSSEVQDDFYEVAARVFMERLNSIGCQKKARHERDFYVAIVSGSNAKGTLDHVRRADWKVQFGVDPKNWPRLNIVVINTTPSTPEEIGFNGNILAFELAEKVRETVDSAGKGGEKIEVKVYGLNAPAVIEDEGTALENIDNSPQIKDVLEITDPLRLKTGKADVKSDTLPTKLDVILTGAGAWDDANASTAKSIFFRLAQEGNVDFERLMRDRIAGDLAFTPVNGEGDPISLYHKNGKKIVFYNAARLGVFKTVAKDTDKAVILVARSGEANKAKIVSASRRYISHCVIDSRTAGGVAMF